MKDRLEKTEQMMQQLKQQIADTEAAEKVPSRPAASKPASAPIPQLPVDHIGTLKQKREVVNSNSDTAPRINNEEIDPALRGYFRLPGTMALSGLRLASRRV